MKRRAIAFGLPVLGAGPVLITAAYATAYVYPIVWPEPPVVTPGENNAAPSDAVVLYDGKNFDAWKGADDWKIRRRRRLHGQGEIRPSRTSATASSTSNGRSRNPPKGVDQGRGNNGIGFMGARYEITGARLLHRTRPFRRTVRLGLTTSGRRWSTPAGKPGEWQTYDNRLHRAALRRRRQSRDAGLRHRSAQRRARAETMPR